MDIFYKYVDDLGGPQRCSEEEFLQFTEDPGYYLPGTALEALEISGAVRTPWRVFSTDQQSTIFGNTAQEPVI